MTDTNITRRSALSLAALIPLSGCVSTLLPEDPGDQQSHAEMTAELVDGGDAVDLTVADMNAADKVLVTTVEGLPADPRVEEEVGSFDEVGDGRTVSLGANGTVIVRSFAAGEIMVVNAYRRHAEDGRLVDMYAGNSLYVGEETVGANVIIERIGRDDASGERTYRVQWVLPTAGTKKLGYLGRQGLTRAEHLTVSVGGLYDERREYKLSNVGESVEVVVGRDETVPVQVNGFWGDNGYVVGDVDLPEDDCGIDDDEFDTNGQTYMLGNCEVIDNE